jgi:hypothetical protein
MGLGSKESTWESPPFKNTKMTFLTFAVGLPVAGDSFSAANALAAALANPIDPNPAPKEQMAWRREGRGDEISFSVMFVGSFSQ